MWIVGTVILEVKIEVIAEQQLAMLDFICKLHTAENIVYISGDGEGLSVWFSWPRQSGDFIAHWSATVYPGANIPFPTKRHRRETDKLEDKLWSRLNQVDPRKKRSS
jgi:hypothetical protein